MSATPGTAPRILIVGGGVAGLEAALALRRLCRGGVEIELLSARDRFAYRPLAVAEPFGLAVALELDLADFGRENGVTVTRGELAKVDPARRRVATADGEWLDYDWLLLATGGVVAPPIPGARSFVDPDGVREFGEILRGVDAGDVHRLVLAGGVQPGWLLPLYELALLTSAYAEARDASVSIAVVTEEVAPLESFGAAIRADVSRLLADREIGVAARRRALRFTDDHLVCEDGSEIAADAAVTIPGLRGPSVAGLPADADGFVPTDDRGRIEGCDRELAAGDLTSFPVKHGGIAAQQADVAADAIAQAVGSEHDGRPFRPSLDGTLLTGEGARVLSTSLAMGPEGGSRHQVEAAWQPLAKVAAKYLGPYLIARAGG